VAGTGALIILGIAWLLFWIVFGHPGTNPPDVVMLASAGLLIVLVLENGSRHDFGPSYRLIVTALCLVLGFLALTDIVDELRLTIRGSYTFDIGAITWWAGSFVAVVGGWMVWRERA
jgi:hypothetical protein